MRRFKRAPVICSICNTQLIFPLNLDTDYTEKFVEVHGAQLPPPTLPCPSCGTPVDTTTAFAFIPGFPPTFESLTKAYQGFGSKWEYNRQSFEIAVHEAIEDPSRGVAGFEQQLNTPDGFEWYRQRMFYRSCVAFHRCFQLFLAFLVMERKAFVTWSKVTGYYSRFYFVQAFLNLLMSTWSELDHVAVTFDGQKVRVHEQKALTPRLKKATSHEVWWALLEAVKIPADYPIENLEFVMSRLGFNPNERNKANYSFEYLGGGFIELDWFDSGAKQLISHFMPIRRSDRDFTDPNRFFEGYDHENVDPGDFYGDTDVQSLWISIVTFLRLVKSLEINQRFVLTENLVALTELHLSGDYPKVRAGIAQSIAEILDDGFEMTVIDDLREFWRF